MRENQTLNQQQQTAASLKMCLTIFIHTHNAYITHTKTGAGHLIPGMWCTVITIWILQLKNAMVQYNKLTSICLIRSYIYQASSVNDRSQRDPPSKIREKSFWKIKSYMILANDQGCSSRSTVAVKNKNGQIQPLGCYCTRMQVSKRHGRKHLKTQKLETCLGK